MIELKRRSVIRAAVGFALGTVALSAVLAARPDETPAAAPADLPKDRALASAIKSPFGYMFQEQRTLKLNGDGHSRDLIITSARDEYLHTTQIQVRSATMQIFRADADKDDFTRKGGVYWTFNGKQGTVQFKQPGALIMVVRDQQDNVQFYTLVHDLRC